MAFDAIATQPVTTEVVVETATVAGRPPGRRRTRAPSAGGGCLQATAASGQGLQSAGRPRLQRRRQRFTAAGVPGALRQTGHSGVSEMDCAPVPTQTAWEERESQQTTGGPCRPW